MRSSRTRLQNSFRQAKIGSPAFSQSFIRCSDDFNDFFFVFLLLSFPLTFFFRTTAVFPAEGNAGVGSSSELSLSSSTIGFQSEQCKRVQLGFGHEFGSSQTGGRSGG